MSLENIISKILHDAQEKAENIKKEVQKTASLIMKEAQEKAQAISWEIVKNTKQKISVENRRFEVSQAIEYKKEILNKKQMLIDEVFKKAKEELINLKETEFVSLINLMLLNSVETGDEVIVMSRRDKGRLGKIGDLKIRAQDNLKDGTFIIEAKNTRLDISLDSVLRELREELVGDVAKILFRKEDKDR